MYWKRERMEKILELEFSSALFYFDPFAWLMIMHFFQMLFYMF